MRSFKVPEKDPLNYLPLTYLWVVGISIWAAVASYARKLKEGRARFSLAELIGEMFISGFVGVLTFWLCEAANIDQPFSAAIIGISAHMGSRSIMLMENVSSVLLKKWIKKNKINLNEQDKHHD